MPAWARQQAHWQKAASTQCGGGCFRAPSPGGLAHDAAIGDRLLHQLWGLSKAVTKKYVLLRWGIRLLSLAMVLGVVAGVLDVTVG
ncbi:MAG: hypothetical protein M3O70_25635 [Actinomycetota bacterium]|nr:hypothetical protein [Actinomycetota bacterium]